MKKSAEMLQSDGISSQIEEMQVVVVISSVGVDEISMTCNCESVLAAYTAINVFFKKIDLLIIQNSKYEKIRYHLPNLKNAKSTHGRVLLLIKLQFEACNFTKSDTPPWVFFTFLKLCK